MTDLNITHQLPVIKVNYDDVRADLEKRLEDYRLAVTEDTVKDAKKAAAELSAMKKDFDERRKEVIRLVSAPIDAENKRLRDLISLIDDGRKHITDQVDVFENKRKAEAKDKAIAYLAEQRVEKGVDPEYQTHHVEDLAKLGTLTAKGNLTAAAINTIRDRVNNEKALQDTVERRTLELENLCYKAGLRAPLSREHVDHFIKDEAEVYARKLEALIHAEVERQIAGDLAKAEQEARTSEGRPAGSQAPEPREYEAPEQSEPEPVKQAEPAPVPSGPTIEAEVTAVFRVSVPPSLTDEQITAELRRVLESAGINTLSECFIDRIQEEEAA